MMGIVTEEVRDDGDRLPRRRVVRSALARIPRRPLRGPGPAARGRRARLLRRLLEDPARSAEIAAKPELIPNAVEESLRYDPSVAVWRRVTTRPVTLGGVDLPAGARLFLWLAATGRDAAAFAEPDRYDLHRPDAERHLAFGKGLHFCLGANLGKLEAQIAIAELVHRYPDLRLVPGQQYTFHANISFRGPQVLMVRSR
jgi:cytochrome P450